MKFYIEPRQCICCAACAQECEYNSIAGPKDEADSQMNSQEIHALRSFRILDSCIGCGDCYEICPVGAIKLIK
ncbi:MAG: 4Fe-4S binding protein [Veillonella sp.]|uniref:4Fe-4S dicluster domain-containing protein n=1 Tax=Veillonella sp. TaxID=1926307 RepID=UPI0025D86E16|nr:4Fe-4S binding protein [Veillonella sp.]MBS4913349.1 4Fe-4S binding protein [Veillonella sp.]